MKTVLILSTYPVGDARHGGQVRLANIIAAYERGGWRAVPLCVYPEEGYPVLSTTRAVSFPQSSSFRLFMDRRIPFIDDLLTGIFATSDPVAWKSLVSLLPSSLDAIHVEQPWLWPVAEKLRGLPDFNNAVLVYGSQNLEEDLKRRILQPYASAESELALKEIGALERRATKTADLVLAVTPVEGATLDAWGAATVELARNGITPWKATEDAVSEWRARLPTAPWLLYIASAHPPNFAGFAELMGESLGCFPPDSALVIAGSVSEHIYHELNSTKWRAVNLPRLRLLYTLNDRDLSAVKTLAHGFFLPVSYGAGSNIKTAEALLSGKYVVGTSVAFRGYEDFRALPEVRVADGARAIHSAIREVVKLPPLQPTDAVGEGPLRRTLTWEHALKNLPDAVAAVKTRAVAIGQAIA